MTDSIVLLSRAITFFLHCFRRNGLRSVPTFLVNIMTQWGTILIYYELPDWVVDASDSLVENENDPDNVKALKVGVSGRDVLVCGFLVAPRIHAHSPEVSHLVSIVIYVAFLDGR